jgi:hypothetical protein
MAVTMAAEAVAAVAWFGVLHGPPLSAHTVNSRLLALLDDKHGALEPACRKNRVSRSGHRPIDKHRLNRQAAEAARTTVHAG